MSQKSLQKVESKPSIKLPVGKSVEFKLPFKADPKKEKIFSERKISIISKKKLRKLGKIKFEDSHLGTLKK